MSRKGENIYKRKDGRWEGRYIKARSESGKAIYGSVYASSYHEAKKKRNLAIASIESVPSASSIKKNTPSPDSFGKLSSAWLNSIRMQIKESTYTKYNNILQSYILPEFVNTLFHDIHHPAFRSSAMTF